jgi:hypothetical protein
MKQISTIVMKQDVNRFKQTPPPVKIPAPADANMFRNANRDIKFPDVPVLLAQLQKTIPATALIMLTDKPLPV